MSNDEKVNSVAQSRRAILQRIASQITNQESLSYTDTPYYNDNAGAGFFPDYVRSPKDPAEPGPSKE
jgi:hypothetical protein